MKMNLTKATMEQLDAIMAFYDDVMERTPHIFEYALWQKGKHPTADGIRAYIAEGCLYLYMEDGVIISALALTPYQGKDYHAIAWKRQLRDDEVAVLHTFAVSPDCQGKGIGAQVVLAAIDLARKSGKKSVRLDTLAVNIPSQALYKKLGFQFRGQQHLYAENTRWTDFYYFEYEGQTEEI